MHEGRGLNYDLHAGQFTQEDPIGLAGGKSGRDRFVPLGERAAPWLDKYLLDVRPSSVRRRSLGTSRLVSCRMCIAAAGRSPDTDA